MSHYLSLLSTVVLPIAIVGLLGYMLQRWRKVDTRTLADVSLYILAPCLVIDSLTHSSLQGHTVWLVGLFTFVQTAATWLLAKVMAKLFRFHLEIEGAVTLTTVFGNAVNYGLPVLLLAYGTPGFVIGTSYVIGQIVLINSLGLYIASRSRVKPREAIIQVLKMPLVYAVLIGVMLTVFGMTVPVGIGNALHLVGNAYSAIVLLVLGIHFTTIKWLGMWRKEVWIPILLRLIIVPMLSLTCIFVLRIHGLLAEVLFVQSSMPAAVNTVILAEKFGSDRQVVTLTVAITTLISFLSLPLLILLGHHL